MRKPPHFVRFVLWVQPYRAEFLLAHGLLFGVLVTAFVYWTAPSPDSVPLVLLFVSLTVGGIGFGWVVWHLFIWPVYAAYPGSTMSPPHVRVYDDDERASGNKADRDARA